MYFQYLEELPWWWEACCRTWPSHLGRPGPLSDWWAMEYLPPGDYPDLDLPYGWVGQAGLPYNLVLPPF